MSGAWPWFIRDDAPALEGVDGDVNLVIRWYDFVINVPVPASASAREVSATALDAVVTAMATSDARAPIAPVILKVSNTLLAHSTCPDVRFAGTGNWLERVPHLPHHPTVEVQPRVLLHARRTPD